MGAVKHLFVIHFTLLVDNYCCFIAGVAGTIEHDPAELHSSLNFLPHESVDLDNGAGRKQAVAVGGAELHSSPNFPPEESVDLDNVAGRKQAVAVGGAELHSSPNFPPNEAVDLDNGAGRKQAVAVGGAELHSSPNFPIDEAVDLDNVAGGSASTDANGTAAQDSAEPSWLSIQRHIQSLVHARQCRDANCELASCQKMKRVLTHTRSCRRKTTNVGTNVGCPVCKQFISLCTVHAKHCQETKCPVPCYIIIKQKLHQRQLQQRMDQAHMMQRQMAAVRSGAVSTIALTPQTLYQPTLDPVIAVGGKPTIATASMVPSVALILQRPSTDQPAAASVLSQENASSVDITRSLMAVQQQRLPMVVAPVQNKTVILSGGKPAAAVGGTEAVAKVKEMKGRVMEDPISDEDDMFAEKSVPSPRLAKENEEFLLERNKKVRLPLFVRHTSL